MDKLTAAQVKFVRSLQTKRVRDAEGLFVAEGPRCMAELRDHFELYLLCDESNTTPTQLEQMSSQRTPQFPLAVFRKPAPATPDTDGLILVLDGVQDPGNVGTIIRTADWFGVRTIFCSRETADAFSPKVVQSTMGALARVQILTEDLPNKLQSFREANLPIYGTLLEGRNMYSDGAIPDRQKGVIIMGNEGNGISAPVRSLITHPLYIPAYAPDDHVESLNVAIATAVILSEFRRA